jgi:hypothetical protein
VGGYTGIALGSAGLVAGSTLIALHGREHRSRCNDAGPSDIDADGDCRFVHRTRGGGIALVVGGAVAAASGIALLVIDSRVRRTELSLRVGLRGPVLAGRF